MWLFSVWMLVLYKLNYFCSKAPGYFCHDGTQVRGMILIMCLVMIDTSEPRPALQRTPYGRVAGGMRREYRIFICKTGSHNGSRGTPSTGWSTRRMDFSVCFLRSLLDGLMHEFVILTERWIYLSLCLLLQWKRPLNAQYSRSAALERGLPSAFALRPMNIC